MSEKSLQPVFISFIRGANRFDNAKSVTPEFFVQGSKNQCIYMLHNLFSNTRYGW